MKLTWKGEEGAPDFIMVTDPVTGKAYKLRPGKAVDVPETLAAGKYLGNPYFEVGEGTSGGGAAGSTGPTGQTGPTGGTGATGKAA